MFNRTKYIILALAMMAVLVGACSTPATTATNPPIATPTPIPQPTPTLAPAPEQPSKLPDRVDVVYFHSGNQCHCMQVVEDNIQMTVLKNFPEELTCKKLTFTSLASDDGANAEVVRKYNTGPFGLFITIVKGQTEKIVPVEEIWAMTGDEAKFNEFVRSAIEKSLKVQS
jgi:hypothetical protein